MRSKSFAIELKGFRAEHGISQEKLAKKIGVSAVSVLLWEKGKTNPKAATLEKVLGVMAKMASKKPVVPAEKKAVKAKVVKAEAKVVKAEAKVVKAPKKQVVIKKLKVSKHLDKLRNELVAVVQRLEAHLNAHITASKPDADTSNSVPATEVPAPSLILPPGVPAPEVLVPDPVLGLVPAPAPTAPAVSANEAKATELLRELIKQIRLSKKDGEVRGRTRHVVEWPDICIAYKRSIDFLHIES